MKRKIFVTRLSAFQIQCGGLDRLRVWFSKPHYSEPYFFKPEENFNLSELEGCYAENGWQCHYGKTQQSVSFGGLFGYESDISEYVWKKLCEHFGNTDFEKWEEYEKENEECCIKNFFLELDLNIEMDVNIKNEI